MKKRIASLLLSVVLCLSLCIPAFAAEERYTGTINADGTEMSFDLENGKTGAFPACSLVLNGETKLATVRLDDGKGTVTIPGTLAAGESFVVTIPGMAIITGTREPQSFTVTFDSQGGSSVPSATVEEGSTVSEPAVPTRTGYTFGGWYTDAACTNAYDFDTPVTSDLTLYAKWNPDTPVGPVAVTGVTLSPTSLTLTVGSSSTLTATVLPANATNKNVTWTSSNDRVATVSANGRVTAVSAGTATITVTTADGSFTATCTVTVTTSGGNQGGNTGSGSSGGGSHGGNVGKPAVVGGNQSSGGNQGGETTGAFSDVQSGAYYADAVQWAVNQGITTGTTSTTFSPNNPCTRAQIVTFLWRANGSPAATGSNPFTDVAQDAYYYDAVLWAVEKGITTGTTATTFSPNNTCTRAQAVTFLHRSAGTPAAGGTNPFTDVGTGAYYTNAVLWAVEKGVTSGTTATTFSPNSTCTRAQIVTFLYRAQ